MFLQNKKIYFASGIAWLIIFISILCLFTCSTVDELTKQVAFARNNAGDSDYYPLEVGNEWEFEKYYYKKGEQSSQRYSTIITGEQDIGNGMIQYYKQKNKEFLIRSKEGILTPSGIFLLKHPISQGEKWVSGKDDLDQRLFRIDDIGLSITIRGKTYDNCLRVIVTSGFHAMLIEGKTTYLSFETYYNYAPNVGPVLIENFEITRSGDRKLDSRTELIHFKRKQAITERLPQIQKPAKLIKGKESFRFPEEGLMGPCLSPDDKWLIYFWFGHGFWAKDEWKREMYYTVIGHSDQKLVPFCRENEIQKVRLVNRRPKWSPDGAILATLYEIDYEEWISFVDFSGEEPLFIESFSGDLPLIWISDRTLLYLDDFGNIMKKEPRKPPEPAVFFRSSYRKPDYARTFQVSSDGTIIYNNEKDSVYLTDMANPSRRIPLYYNPKYNPKKEKSVIQGLKLSSSYDLSPIGEYAVFYLPKTDRNSKRMGGLVNLKTFEVIDRFSVHENERALWSPDGTKLAYLEDTNVEVDKNDPSKRIWRNPHFFILDLETGKRQDFGRGVSKEFNWTPDGHYIIYTMKYAHESLGIFKNGIFIMRSSDGEEIGQLTRISAFSILYMSPSLRYIVWEALDMDKFFIVENPFRATMLEH